MRPANLVVIMSDEHHPRAMGVAGHPFVDTPNLDRLAARGTRFDAAYCNSPICVPSRASFATGRYVHELGNWDNAIAYDGSVPGWGHALQRRGHRVDSIGKLHYRNAEDPTGFDHQYHPMHIYGGYGMVWGALRDGKADFSERAHTMLDPIGAGNSKYNIYDDRIATEAETWLARAARENARSTVGIVRRLRGSAFPADRAARTSWTSIPSTRCRRRVCIPRTGIRAIPGSRPAITCIRSTMRSTIADDAGDGVLLRVVHLGRSPGRPCLDAHRSQRPRRDHARRLHQRPRRQYRCARHVG